MFSITLYEAELGAITDTIHSLTQAKTQKDFKKYTNQIISFLYTIRPKKMSEKSKDLILIHITRTFDLDTKDIYYTFLFNDSNYASAFRTN